MKIMKNMTKIIHGEKDNESDYDHEDVDDECKNNDDGCKDDDCEECNEECRDCEEVYDKECEQGNDEEIIENDATSCTCVESESDCEGDTSVSVQDSSMESSGEGMQLHFIDFSHQQSRVEAYISEGKGERKASTPKQLAIALSTKCVRNTTVLLVKPKYYPPFMTAKVAPINGISTFLTATYNHHSSNPTVSFFHNLGPAVPSLIKKLTTAPCFSYEQDPFGNPGDNFSECKVQFHNKGSERHTTKARSRYTRTPAKKSKRQLKKEEMDCTKTEAIKEICSIFPHCELCY